MEINRTITNVWTIVLHEEEAEKIRAFFAQKGREMPENNLRQAMLPEGCTVFFFFYGTAPGFAFIADGATVIMTRTAHEATVSNIERAEMANEAGANLCVRIHADGSDNKSIHGISVLVPEGNLLGTPAIVEPSRSAGEAVHDALIDATGAEDHGIVERTDLTGFNWSEVPVILVEMGFLSNDEEDAKLATDEYREILAEGMHQGIRNWLMNK